jgi:hypothetical protein
LTSRRLKISAPTPASITTYYHDSIFQPWFDYSLRGKGALRQAEATIFETGANEWKQYDAWPPTQGVEPRRLYFRDSGKLSFDPAAAADAPYDEYVSDPANPVPYRTRGPLVRQSAR